MDDRRRENQRAYLEYFFGRSSVPPQVEKRNDLDDTESDVIVDDYPDSANLDRVEVGLEDFLIR